MMSQSMRAILLLVLFLVPASLEAQTGQSARGADSLRNGIITGAIVGALGGSFAGLAIAQDCFSCYGFHVPATLGVVGAGIGAGIGAGVDALRRHQSTRRPVGVMPFLTPRARGAMIWVRF
jgi:hypothetical protein